MNIGQPYRGTQRYEFRLTFPVRLQRSLVIVRRALRNYLNNTAGNTAIMMALAAIPLMLAAGAAVDMVRANNTRTVLQSAADAAALAGAMSGKTGEEDLKAIVEDYLKANHAENVLTNVKKIKQKLNTSKRTFSVEINGKLDTAFMFLGGITNMEIGAYAEVELGGNGLEVVLALDNTESMNYEGRMPALKTAAKSLVDTVLDAGSSSGAYVRIGVVPFSNYVNVGLANRSKSWIDVPADSSDTVPNCNTTYPDATKTNCRMETYTGYADGVPQTYTTEVCDWNYGTPVTTCNGTYTYEYKWQGCVGSRDSNRDVRIDSLSNKYPGIIKAYWGYQENCAKPITMLTNNKAALNDAIDAMVGVGNTYIAPGVLWGWNMLDSSEPLTGAKTKSWMKTNKGTKALVVMTDGDNTLSPHSITYKFHEGNDINLANQKTADTCANAKKDGIQVYTVAFKVTNTTAKDILKNCASQADMAFTADDATALNSAFNDIAKSLVATRLTK